VVVKPLVPPPIAPALMSTVPTPLCSLPVREEYEPREIARSIDCWRKAWSAAAAQHQKLAAAVRVREAKMKEAAKVAVK
jgi:hypothetical protein